ncbi:MAG: GNAT family N-acetyltransferase [Sphaerochaetaceae bacterium]
MFIGPLTSINAKTFNEAFHGYSVPVSLDQKTFESNLKKNSYCRQLSVGLYEGEKLVGFILNGKRGDSAYDCGTAIMDEYRGLGYANGMVEFAIEQLERNSMKRWILEVITNNTKAFKLYTKYGFVPNREFYCYRIETHLLRKKTTVTLKEASYALLNDNTACVSSWQNCNASLILGKTSLYSIWKDDCLSGYCAFDKKTGTIMQLYLNEAMRNKGIALECLYALSSLTKNVLIKFINVDKAYTPMNCLLEKAGFSIFCMQYEMQKMINSVIV